MSFQGWRRRLRGAVAGIAFYFTIWLAELSVISFLLKRPVGFAYLFWDAPLWLNTLAYFLIPAVPLAVAGWFYRGRRRDFIAITAAVLFAVFLWVPWLGTVSAPLPVDTLVKKAVENGYEICGIYRAEVVDKVFVYEETLTAPKRCFFLILRPEPGYLYKLVFLNRTTEIKLLGMERSNMYTYYSGGFFATQFYLNRPERLRNFVSASDGGIVAGDRTIHFGGFVTAAGENAMADDHASWFTFSPEPGGVAVRITHTIKVRAEPYVPWS